MARCQQHNTQMSAAQNTHLIYTLSIKQRLEALCYLLSLVKVSHCSRHPSVTSLKHTHCDITSVQCNSVTLIYIFITRNLQCEALHWQQAYPSLELEHFSVFSWSLTSVVCCIAGCCTLSFSLYCFSSILCCSLQRFITFVLVLLFPSMFHNLCSYVVVPFNVS